LDLNLSPGEQAFRDEVRNWIGHNLPPEWTVDRLEELPQREAVACSRKWQERLGAAGWLGLAWPREYGGRGATLMEQAIYIIEAIAARAPMPADKIGLNLVGPALCEIGSPQQKQRFLGKILHGQMLWCQGFSEPNAGSDLASVQTKAVLEGDEWVINGQKIWSSDAPWADWCTLLARTNPQAPKHKGLSMLAVPMNRPGITVRPIKQVNTREEFAEIFFDNVRVPRDSLIGELGTGWNVTMRMLTYERGLYTLVEIPRFEKAWRQEVEYCKSTRRNGRLLVEDPTVRERLAQAYANIQMMRLTNLRYITRYLRGIAPGEESSLMKLHWALTDQGLYDLAMALGGPSALAMLGAPRAICSGHWTADYFYSRACTIYGGTQDIHRNLVAERIYGLPR
jgi:alkylation response protein AidB-like acyl-CoA dehydrogenase